MTLSLVQLIQRDITQFEPIDERTRASKERILFDIAALPRPFDEHADPTHLTASAIVVGEEGVLLHFHKKLRMWLQPGGHIEANETPWDAALREVLEETGLRAVAVGSKERLLHIDVHQAGAHTHLDLRYLLCASGTPAPPEGESPLVRWFWWKEAMARRSGPSLRQTPCTVRSPRRGGRHVEHVGAGARSRGDQTRPILQ
jgi:8-oxo-dGTP pyrophosphatase MutT (NUDIX family)